MRRVVFFGNCQMATLCELYRRVAGKSVNVLSYEDLSDQRQDTVVHADIVIKQMLDFERNEDLDKLFGTSDCIPVPVVSAPYLWPFAGSQHPNNPHPSFLPMGPYPAEYGDSYLNKLIAQGGDQEYAACGNH